MTRPRPAPWAIGLVTAMALTAGLAEVTQGQSRTVYLVATAHLDTQWNWTVQDSIRQFIPNTFYTNLKYFEQYPDYVFSWEGAIHYMWFKEYHLEGWPTVKQYVANGRWRLAGSWIDAVDTNIPSPESLMRQALYGNRFFRQEFGKVSRDVYLPDCFGFGWALPSIAAHSGLKSFSTQKLTWGRPIPFPIGRWKGVDGSEILAELDPKSYTTRITTDISSDPSWQNQFTPLGDGASVEFRYFGTGDIGGGPVEESVQNYEKAVRNAGSGVRIKNTSPDQLALDLTPQQFAALPEHDSELLLKTHGTGCYTSQAAMKAFNRQNELLADASERAAVAAEWLTGQPYPAARLREAWIRFLWHQFHDDLTGTSIPQAYQFSWNDEVVSLNQFAGVLTSSTSAVAGQLNTEGPGIPLVVYNPLSIARRDAVEATVHFPGPAPAAIRVTDAATGQNALAQVLSSNGQDARILFLADLPSVGYKVFHVTAQRIPNPDSQRIPNPDSHRIPNPDSHLSVTLNSLENNRLSVKIDRNGDISSIVDKDARRELLRAPAMLELRDDPSTQWPAWEVLYDVVQAPAREYLARPTVAIVEHGPVRVALEITRKAAGSTFVQRVRLIEGGDRVDVENLVDWRSPNTLLKASFPLAASNPKATYDLGLGTIERTGNEPDKYEVPAQKWADLTDISRSFGVGIINDSKYGWDKPTDDTLRLTLLHTPRTGQGYTYQNANDLGHHRFVYAIAGHAGDWRQGRMPLRASELNQAPVAFQTIAHESPLGRSFSLVTLDDRTGQVAVAALKKAEDSEEYVVRLLERHGQPVRVTVRLPAGVTAIRELNAAEEEVGPFALGGRGGGARGRGGQSTAAPSSFPIDLKAYQPRTLAFKLDRPTMNATPPSFAPIDLPFNLDGVSTDRDRGDGDFDGQKHTLAGEQLPAELQLDGIAFKFGPTATGAKNVLVPRGQRLTIPAGPYNRLYVLAAAIGGDVPATFTVGQAARTVTIREWQGAVGQWDSRLKAPRALYEPFVPSSPRGTPSQDEIRAGLVVNWDPSTETVTGIDQIRPGFVKRDEIAWVGSHCHAPGGDQIYVASYLFRYAIDLPPGVHEVGLPVNERIRILAATAVNEPAGVVAATRLYAPDLNDPRTTSVRPPVGQRGRSGG